MGQKPEALVQGAIIGWLAAKRIWFMRIQTGALKVDKRLVRFGNPGMADILALYPSYAVPGFFIPVFIEVKSNIGRQSELQKSFEVDVLERGMHYILARSVDDVEEYLRRI